MSVIIRLQNLPWSANALDIRNFFRGLSIPEGGVHIVGGELGDAFIAFSTDEDARQAMMLDGGKIKEIQVKLFLSSRSEMHKVIEAARQSVPILSLAPTPAPAPVAPPQVPTPPQPTLPVPPAITPFSAALGTNPLSGFGIPGIGNPQEIPQPAVIEPPAPLISPPLKSPVEEDKEEEKVSRKRSKEKDRRRTRSRSRSRDRDRKDRKRDRRDRSRSRERRRRDRSRSRDRRDRKRDRKDRSRSRERSPRRSRDKRGDRRSPHNSQERSLDSNESSGALPASAYGNNSNGPQMSMVQNSPLQNGPMNFNDPSLTDAFNKLQELGKKRNPNAFQGDQQNGSRFQGGRGSNNSSRGGASFRRDGRPSRFDEQQRDCCVAIRNAPNHTSYGDVRRFFPFMIDKHGIKMINDNMGRRTGNIFVRFCDPRSKQLALQRKSNELKGAQVVVESLDDDAYESAVDSFLPYREDNDDEDASLIIADGDDSLTKKFCALKLSDLPNFVKEHDIMKAFSDFSLLSILLNDCRVSRTKIAFVQFVKPDEAKSAFDRRETYLFGRRQAVITPMSDEEFAKEKINHDKTEQPILKGKIIENEQVPEPVIPRDPRQRRQIDNGPSSQGSPAMQAPVQTPFFPNTQFPQNFGTAFQSPQFNNPTFPGQGNMEPRASPTTWGTRMNFPKQPDQRMPAMQVPQVQVPPVAKKPAISVNMEDEALDCVLMKGLPRDATDRTIVNFLADTGAVPARIHLMLDSNGLPSGDCFCEFRSGQEARKAATKHGQTLEGCRVTVDLVMRSVVEEALEGPKMDGQQPTPQQQVLLGNVPPPFMNTTRGGFMGRGQFRGRGSFDRGGFNRGGFDQRGGFRGRGWMDRGRGFDRGRGRGFPRGRGGFDNGQMHMRSEEEQDPALENFGAPGCVVTMENVPFRATVDDIMTFFGDFELTQDDIIRRYNERGQPTGDARVAFRTPFDAQRAIKTRHMNSIYDRRHNLNNTAAEKELACDDLEFSNAYWHQHRI
ncbi:unnamed protein product, partial [Brenthis ino]